MSVNVNASLDPDLDCPEYSASDEALLDGVSFWVEGVLQCAVAAFGVAGNTVASLIISRREMRNSFNLLLVSLACFDSTYLVGSILESVRTPFGMASRWHVALFPHLLYPFHQVVQTYFTQSAIQYLILMLLLLLSLSLL